MGFWMCLPATRAGRSAILELKTSEPPVFLLSAKYWLRLQRHLQQQDFSRYGYFTGVTLQPAPHDLPRCAGSALPFRHGNPAALCASANGGGPRRAGGVLEETSLRSASPMKVFRG